MIRVTEYTKKPITFIGKCVGNCYGSDTTDPAKNYARGKQCIEDGHGRVEEYPSITFEIDGYSIKTIRELYTHIVGVTRTQESTRYVNMKERGYFTPPKIEFNEDANGVYKDIMTAIWKAYEDLLALGIPKEDASMVLPLGMKTKITIKMEIRALLNIAQVRLCSRAYHELRKLMLEIRRIIAQLDDEWQEVAFMMKPKCEVIGYCTEHYSCGRRLPKKVVMEMIEREMKKQRETQM